MKHSERKKIDESIQNALKQVLALENRSKMTRISESTNISLSRLSKYASGGTKTISQADWDVLAPYLADFLPPEEASIDSLLSTAENTKPTKGVDSLSEFSGNQKESVFRALSQGKKIIIGDINVYGVPTEKLIEALKNLPLTEQQKKDFLYEIFDKP